MKRTLAFSLYLGIATLVAAQTATVAEKPAAHTSSASPSQAAPANKKPSPLGAGVKVVTVGASKPAQASSANAVKGKGASAAATTPVAKATPAAKPGTQVVEVPRGKSPFNRQKKSGSLATKHSSGQAADSEQPVEELKPQVAKKIGAAGRRDPFVSPVVNLSAIGSGCSSGKRCLAIEQIALRGVVKSDTGMIAVVVNALDKAYFLRENDPVFNGYVQKITPDSIVFRETFHDKLGKAFTRDVTKSISRPVA